MSAKISIILLFCGITYVTWAQNLTGKVVDASNNEVIPFAKLTVIDFDVHTASDIDGNFTLTNLPAASIKIKVKARDYETKLVRVNPSNQNELTIKMESGHTVFEEVTVTASEGRLQREQITAVEYRSSEDLFESGASTLGQAIQNIPGVQQSTIGTGISRPVIRGLSGMRVVTYWDGLRIENQQWGQDHGMGTSELGLGGVEVIKGPASLLYGADALGGVIHYRDKGYVAEGVQKFYVSSRLESNSLGTTNEVGYQMNNGKLKINVFGNYLNHKDFQLPNGRFLENSRFWSSNFKTSIGFRKDNYIFDLRYHGSYGQLGIPGHTHDVDPEINELTSSLSGRRASIPSAQFIFNNFITVKNRWLFDRSDLLIQLGNTSNSLREFDHNFEAPFTNLVLNNSTYNIRYNYYITENLNLKGGLQGMFQMNRNLELTESYLIPDANSFDNGAYAVLNYDLNKWRFQGGVRYDFRQINSFKPNADSAVVSNISTEPVDELYQTVNYSAGFVRNSKRTTLRFNASSGFRAPTLSELTASGVHHGSFRYEQGDQSLVPEKAIQLDLAVELHFDHFEFVVNPYFSMIEDFIYLKSTDSVVDNQVGTFSYFEFDQVNQAYLYGGEVGFHYHPHQLHRLHLESNFSLTIGENDKGGPLNLMPQPHFNSRVRFDINNKGTFQFENITLEHQHFMQQDRVGEFEAATDAFHLINLAAHMKYTKKQAFNFTVGARNLLNKRYIAHLSPLKNLGNGVPQQGINVFLKATYSLKHKKDSKK
ncbi:MAG: TonB-dependent receptor [Bacteroidota bacterium]